MWTADDRIEVEAPELESACGSTASGEPGAGALEAGLASIDFRGVGNPGKLSVSPAVAIVGQLRGLSERLEAVERAVAAPPPPSRPDATDFEAELRALRRKVVAIELRDRRRESKESGGSCPRLSGEPPGSPGGFRALRAIAALAIATKELCLGYAASVERDRALLAAVTEELDAAVLAVETALEEVR